MIDPVANPVLAAHILSRMLSDPDRDIIRTDGAKIEKLISVNCKEHTACVEQYTRYSVETVPIAEMSMEGFRHAEEFKTDEIKYTPEFWREQLLTSDEVSEICEWLMHLQAAHVMADSLMEHDDEVKNEDIRFYKSNYRKGLDNCCKLVRHLGALKKGVF